MPRRFLPLLCLLLPAFAVPAQETAAERLEAVQQFRTYFRKFKEEAQQREAVLTLEHAECVEAVEELLKLLKHSSPVVQQTAFAVLAGYGDPASFQPWLDSLATLKDEEQRALLIKVFGRSKLKQALPAVLQVAAESKSQTVRYEAARTIGQIGDESAVPVVEGMLADGDPLVRMAAVDCVGQLDLDALGPKIVPLLKDDEWQVRTSAITAAGIVRPQAAVQPLIDVMREAGRLRIECADALFRITGYDFGVDPDRWQQQWNSLMEIEGWRIPTDEEIAKKAESRKKYDAFYGKKESHNTFAKIPTTSTRVLFIIDISGSMDDLVVEREKFQGYDNFRKFTIVKTELLRTIDTLTNDTLFDICAFASELHPWKKRLVPANIVNREAAKSWVGRLKPLGGTEDQELAAAGLGGLVDLSAGKTNTLKALLYAFGVDPDKQQRVTFTGGDKAVIKNKLDTVYFLSDGRPSIGKIIDTIEILKEVRRYNEIFKIVIHAIAIGEFQKEFLRELAEHNGGVFVDLGR